MEMSAASYRLCSWALLRYSGRAERPTASSRSRPPLSLPCSWHMVGSGPQPSRWWHESAMDGEDRVARPPSTSNTGHGASGPATFDLDRVHLIHRLNLFPQPLYRIHLCVHVPLFPLPRWVAPAAAPPTLGQSIFQPKQCARWQRRHEKTINSRVEHLKGPVEPSWKHSRACVSLSVFFFFPRSHTNILL